MNRIAMLLPLAVALAFELPIAGGRAQDDTASDVVQSIEAKRGVYAEVAKQIWSLAEVGYQEEKSSALLQSHLAAAGFTVQKGVADIPTAFVASYGTGKPVVAMIGEFDALPGLSQEAVPRRKPIVENGPGHGCGHHLFGTGSVAAAIAVKEWMAAHQRSGTVRFYGTPAEEGGSGKVYMVRAGLFSDVDAVIGWHPADRNEVSVGTTLANVSAKFRFRGISAHASAAPEKGRSALDGVEAMNYMVNMMREQIQPLRTSSTGGSSDMGDVSWVVPTVQVRAATWVPGTAAHSWQAVACGGTSIGVKGMLVAAKTMALTARDLFTEPGHVQKARAEFDNRRGNFVYKPRIGDRKPALDYRK